MTTASTSDPPPTPPGIRAELASLGDRVTSVEKRQDAHEAATARGFEAASTKTGLAVFAAAIAGPAVRDQLPMVGPWMESHPEAAGALAVVAYVLASVLAKREPPPAGTWQYIVWQLLTRLSLFTTDRVGGSLKLPGTLGPEDRDRLGGKP